MVEKSKIVNVWIHNKIDSTLKANNIPGLAVGIVNNSKLKIAGFGTKERGVVEEIDENSCRACTGNYYFRLEDNRRVAILYRYIEGSEPERMQHIESIGNLVGILRNIMEKFNGKFGYTPGVSAAYAYDGMNLILEAIHTAGTEREAIREFLSGIEYLKGVTGSIPFDELGNRTGSARLTRIQDGQPCIRQSR